MVGDHESIHASHVEHRFTMSSPPLPVLRAPRIDPDPDSDSDVEVLPPPPKLVRSHGEAAEEPSEPASARKRVRSPLALDPGASSMSDINSDDDTSTRRRKKNRPVKNKSKKRGYLYKGIQHSLTWPKTGWMEREDVLEGLKECAARKNHSIVQAFVCREFHKGGEVHFHAYVKLDGPMYVYPHDWDIKSVHETCDPEDPEVIVHHGQYEPVKNVRAWTEYIFKEDPEVLCYPANTSIKDVVAARKSHTSEAYERILREGKLTAAVIEDHPSVLPQLDKIVRNVALFNAIKSRESITVKKPASWFQWQRAVLNVVDRSATTKLSTKADREITWIVDPVGNCGKSFLARYLTLHHKAFYCTGGKKSDIAHAYDGEPVVIFDFSREIEDQAGVYATIENLKNGMIFSGKYESGVKFFQTPLVFVFSNWVPDVEKFSIDRWGEGVYSLEKRENDCVLLGSAREECALEHLLMQGDELLLEELVEEMEN
jgi:hypothetical protein